MEGIDGLLLASGAVRVLFWMAGAVIAYRERRVLPLLGFGFAGVFASVFAVSNAGGSVPPALFDAAAFASTPTAALLFAALYFGARRRPNDGGWQL